MLNNQLGEYKKAVDELVVATAVERGYVDYLLLLGQSYEKLGDKAKAKSAYEQALKFNPNADGVKAALVGLK